MKNIDLTIHTDGSVELDLGGFTGKACLQETDRLEALLKQAGLAVELTGREEKPEMALQHHNVQENVTGRQGPS